MNLACQKWLGNFTKVLGNGWPPPSPFGKNSQKIPFFFLEDPPNACKVVGPQPQELPTRPVRDHLFSCEQYIHSNYLPGWEHPLPSPGSSFLQPQSQPLAQQTLWQNCGGKSSSSPYSHPSQISGLPLSATNTIAEQMLNLIISSHCTSRQTLKQPC